MDWAVFFHPTTIFHLRFEIGDRFLEVATDYKINYNDLFQNIIVKIVSMKKSINEV